MAVNPDLVGRDFPPTAPYLVGREKVREFARATYVTDPISLDVDAAVGAGYADLVAPPTFGMVIQDLTMQQLLADPDAGFELSQLIHAEQRFSYTRPIVAGDELTAKLAITNVRPFGAGAMVTSVAAITTTDGDDVLTATSVLLVGGEVS